jgi:parallel beta-helix repeat protein
MNPIIPTNGMLITENTVLASGVYYLPDGIRIAASNITLEGNNTTIVSDKPSGTAIHLQGQNGVTIRNLSVQGYYHALRIEEAEDITIEKISVRNTAEIAGVETFLYLWKPITEAYAGAMLLHKVKNSHVQNCDVQHQMNGILLYDCENLTVRENNASFNSGWGIYLSHTNDSLIEANRLDFCNRVYRHTDGISRVEADAAGLVMVNGSSRNKLLKNSCLCGGDGIFLCGYEHPGNLRPCNDNLFEDNDCRLSPNNAIEATFSANNIFRRNDCSRSNYGFWMGYSWDCVLEENHVEFNRWVGIAIEHGFNWQIVNNKIQRNGEGIRLWTRGGQSVLMPFYPAHKVPHHFTIRQNIIEANNIGFNGYTGDDVPETESHNFILEDNSFHDNRLGLRFVRVKDCRVAGNRFSKNVEKALEHGDGVEIGENEGI